MREANFQSAIEFRTNRMANGLNAPKSAKNAGHNKRGKSFSGIKDKKLDYEEESKLSNIITQVQRKNAGTPSANTHM